MPQNVNVLTVFNSEDGATKFREDVISLKSGSSDFLQASPLMTASDTCKRYLFYELPAGYYSEKDFSQRRQICVVISGKVEIVSSDKDTRELHVGDVIRLEDVDFRSPGRSLKVLGNEPAQILSIQLE